MPWCALDLRRDHRLLAHEGVDEPIERWHHLACQIEPNGRLVGFPKATLKLAVSYERWPGGSHSPADSTKNEVFINKIR